MQQLDERLKGQYASLSPQEQRVADFIFDHFDDLISYNSAELAQLSGVSKATVSRLFKRLGYDKYKDMRDELRTLRQSGMPLTDQRDAVQGNTLLARHYKQEMANLTQWVNALDARQFAEALTAMVAARRIVVIGMRNAYPAALHLRQQLLQARGQVLVLPQPGQSLSEELVDLTADDLVMMAFRRRPRIVRPLLQQLQRDGVPVLLMCEPQAHSLFPLSRWQLCAPLDSVSAYDSYASVNSLINLLANAFLHETLDSGRPGMLSRVWGGYVEIIRNTPFVVQLFFIVFGLPNLGLKMTAGEAALLAMVVNLGAYSTEIVRAGIQVTPKGQWEAGRVLGLSRTQTFVRVVLPPALQRIYPALVSQCIIVMLGSSVVSQVSYEELTFAANLIQSRTFLSFEVYLVTTGIYLALSIAMRQLLMAAGRKWLGVQA